MTATHALACALSLSVALFAACGEVDDDAQDFRVSPSRACTGCKYKSQVSFSSLPTGTITSAQVEVKVTHDGPCPQEDEDDDCTEVMTYDVLCKLGTASTITVPFFIDAPTNNRTHIAKLTVVKNGNTTVHTGSVNHSSDVTGGAAPPVSIPTPCPPPSLDPYTTFPAIE